MKTLVQAADFKRVLATPSAARSAHFSLHHVDGRPLRFVRSSAGPSKVELSTPVAPCLHQPVDDSVRDCWLGLVVPKRHARRAVTRTLLKRQIREAAKRHATRFAQGLWVLRLRAPFDPLQFPSAASPALRKAASSELDRLLARVGA